MEILISMQFRFEDVLLTRGNTELYTLINYNCKNDILKLTINKFSKNYTTGRTIV